MRNLYDLVKPGVHYKNLDELYRYISNPSEFRCSKYKGVWKVEVRRFDHKGRVYCIVEGKNKTLNHSFTGMFELTLDKRPNDIFRIIIDMIVKSVEQELGDKAKRKK